MNENRLISYHGCHSGQFCNHAADRLEDMIVTYIEQGFDTVGITEHIPPPDASFMYEDEAAAGLTLDDLTRRFDVYCRTVRQLQQQHAGNITLLLGFETESYTGYAVHVRHLIRQFKPDYIVGSVHHVKDICFDYSPRHYHRAAEACGGITQLYHDYFDLQHEMIQALEPTVVGHFDLVRIHDADYESRLTHPGIQARILRNLELIRQKDLIMDLNLRALAKGASEPYISGMILDMAGDLDIKVAPGEDAHCIADIGRHIHQGIQLLADRGFDTQWPLPRLYQYPEPT